MRNKVYGAWVSSSDECLILRLQSDWKCSKVTDAALPEVMRLQISMLVRSASSTEKKKTKEFATPEKVPLHTSLLHTDSKITVQVLNLSIEV